MISLVLIAVTGVVVFLCLLTYMGFAPVPTPTYDTTTATIRAPDNTLRGELTTRIADTHRKRYIGLSRTQSLGENEGMLFVFSDEKSRTMAMRAMDYPLDIIFIDDDGTIANIDTADAPSGVTGYFVQERASSRCSTVIETRAGWADQHDITEGDTVAWN